MPALQTHSVDPVSVLLAARVSEVERSEPPEPASAGGSLRSNPDTRLATCKGESYRSYWPLLIILVLSAALRVSLIHGSLWLDELHTAWVVSDGPFDIFERARIGNHSPVYFVLPWITTSLFGMSEWALRLPSLLAGLAVVAAVYGITLTITRSLLAAVTAALFATFDHNFLFYATEARPYACVQLVAAIQLVLFWKLQARGDYRLRVAFVSTTCLLMYLHYTAILVVFGELVAQGFWAWLGTSLRRDDRPRSYSLTALMCDLVIVAALTLPALFHLAHIAAHRGNWQTFVRDTDLAAMARWFSLASYVVIAGLAAMSVQFFERGVFKRGALAPRDARDAGPTRTSFGLLLTCWFVVPVIAAWIATSWGLASLYFPRYLIGLAIGPMLLGGLFVGSIARPRWRLVATAVVVAYACYTSAAVWQLYHFGRLLGERREDWRSAVTWLDNNYDAGNSQAGNHKAPPVFVRSGLLEADNLRSQTTPLFKQYCLCPVNSMYPFKERDVLVPLPTRQSGALSRASIDLIRRDGRAWFIINAPARSHEAIRQQVFSALESAELQVQSSPSHAFGSVHVWRVEVQ